MPTYTPTQKQIEESKAYIRQRISNQNALEEYLYEEYNNAAEKIALIILKYNARNARLHFTGSWKMASEIQVVIDELESKIDEYVSYYCIPEESDDDEEISMQIYDRVFTELDHGYSYKDRKTLYLSNMIKALSDTDFSEFEDEELLVNTINEATEKSKNRMLLLALNSVAVGFAFYSLMEARKSGATRFVSYTNSEHPCSYCESANGVIQPIEDFPNGGHHPRCRCYFVFI